METSSLIAQIIAITYLTVGTSILLGNFSLKEIINDFEKSPALRFISALIAVIIGVLIIQNHNKWEFNWSVIITIIGWLALIKGILIFLFKNYLSPFKGIIKYQKPIAVFIILLGIALAYISFKI